MERCQQMRPRPRIEARHAVQQIHHGGTGWRMLQQHRLDLSDVDIVVAKVGE